ncbi:MAG: PD40 domain-containing protein [Deltaproteobacteria bacterium]|nr:PD40 domain-containing protein [Deltaproteobacteria bacterium]
MKYLTSFLFIFAVSFSPKVRAVQCPIPNCPAGQLCFCPPPPPHYLVLDFKTGNLDTKARKILVEHMTNNFDMTAIFKLKKSYKPRGYKSSTPVDQIPRWSVIKIDALKNGTGIDFRIEYHERFPSHSRKSILKWKTNLKIRHQNETTLRNALDAISNQCMAKILGRKFDAFGSRLAYVETLSVGKSVIRVSAVNGKSYKTAGSYGKLLSFSRSLNKEPAWSNGNRYIVFTSHIRYNPDLYIVKSDGSKSPHRISARKGMNHAAAFSPDNTRLALTMDYKGNPDIYLLHSEFNSTRKWRVAKKLTKHHNIDTSPVFSPDGKKIAFVSARRGNAQIYIKHLSTGKITRLLSTSNRTFTPKWCKSGNREYIAFTQLVGNRSVIYIYNVLTRAGWQATSTSAPNAENPTWSPHCNLLAYESAGSKTAAAGIRLSPVQGGSSRLVLSGKLSMPAWETKKK